MNVDAYTVLWILDFLTNRPQCVRLASGLPSDLVFTNTGGPQGTCLSPFLFTLYTANCQSTHDECQTDKCADDSAQIEQITDDDDRHYLQDDTAQIGQITDDDDRHYLHFVQWCYDNFLELDGTYSINHITVCIQVYTGTGISAHIYGYKQAH